MHLKPSVPSALTSVEGDKAANDADSCDLVCCESGWTLTQGSDFRNPALLQWAQPHWTGGAADRSLDPQPYEQMPFGSQTSHTWLKHRSPLVAAPTGL